MKRYLLSILSLGIFFIPFTSNASVAFVQSGSNDHYTASSVTVTLGSATTVGDILAVQVGVNGVATTLSSVSANCVTGNFTLLNNPTTFTGTSYEATGYGIISSSASCTITATLSGTNTGNLNLIVHEISGVSTSSPVDGYANNVQATPGNSTNAITSGAITTSQSGDYIFGSTFGANGSFDASTTAGTGYTQREYNAGDGYASEDKIQSGAGSVAATFSNTNSGLYENYITAIIAFAPATSSTPPVTYATNCQTFSPTSSECKLIQARIQTQYYIQYGFDFLWIVAFAWIIIYALTKPNWLSEIMKKVFK